MLLENNLLGKENSLIGSIKKQIMDNEVERWRSESKLEAKIEEMRSKLNEGLESMSSSKTLFDNSAIENKEIRAENLEHRNTTE